MAEYLVLMTDECGHETSATVEAETSGEAWELAEEDYPECRVYGIKSEADLRDAEADRYFRANLDHEVGW